MEKKNSKMKSTTSKALFGTLFSNGLVMTIGGGVVFIIGLFMNMSFLYQLSRVFGNNDSTPMYLMYGGGALLIIGIGCLSIHHSKLKK